MPARPRLASMGIAVLLLGVVGLSTAPTVQAGSDPICATKPEQCVGLTLRLSGYLAGDAAADANQATQVLTCHHDPGGTIDACSGMFGVPLATREINVAAFMSNPAGATICINGTCGSGSQNKNITLTSGGRSQTANITFNPANGTTVNVSKTGTGTGTVTSSPGSISCGSACTWMFFPSTAVTLTATPTGDSLWGGWGAGVCSGQGATCHFTTGGTTTTENISASFTSPTPVPTSTPQATSTPVPTKTPSPTKTPTPSAGASTGPTFKPPTIIPATAQPGGPTLDPNVTIDPNATQNDIPSTDPNAGPTPTPFKVTTNDPNRTEVPLNALPSSAPTEPAGGTGSGPPLPIVIGLILLLGALVGGGVFWWARRRPTPAG